MTKREEYEDLSRNLRDKAEDKLTTSPEVPPDLIGKTQEEIIHELHVNQIELEIQNEELKKAHLELEISRDRYIDLYDFAPVGYLTLTDTALISEVNLSGASMLGILRKKKTRARFRSFILPQNHDLWDQFFVIVLKQGVRQTIELQLKRMDGHEFTARLEGIRVETADGLFQVRIAISDVTDLKRAEKHAFLAEEEWKATFNTVSDLIYILDTQYTIRRMNRAMAERLGMTTNEAVGKTCYRIIHGTQHPPASCPHTLLLEDQQEHTIEMYDERLGGIFLITCTPVWDNNGTLLGSVHVARDVTERKRIEEALHESNKKLNILASITRHDIGNELDYIFRYLALIKENDLNPQIKGFIKKIDEYAQNIERQISFTRDYQDIGVHSPIWQHVSTVISRAVLSLQISPIQVHIDLPAIEIYADPLMEKVFYNLIDNAKRYGEKITKIRFSGFEGTEGYTIICEDDGVGILKENKSKIFNREYYKHTGFGLNFSREILEITKITITETGEQGKGARFEILVLEGKFRKGDSESI